MTARVILADEMANERRFAGRVLSKQENHGLCFNVGIRQRRAPRKRIVVILRFDRLDLFSVDRLQAIQDARVLARWEV